MLDNIEEFSGSEYGFDVAQQLFNVLAEPLLNEEPVLKIEQVLIKFYLFHIAVVGVINYKEKETIVVRVVD
jgi:hypothetical protein